MKYLISYNESLRDKMTPRSEEDVLKASEKLNAHNKIVYGIQWNNLTLVKKGIEELLEANYSYSSKVQYLIESLQINLNLEENEIFQYFKSIFDVDQKVYDRLDKLVIKMKYLNKLHDQLQKNDLLEVTECEYNFDSFGTYQFDVTVPPPEEEPIDDDDVMPEEYHIGLYIDEEVNDDFFINYDGQDNFEFHTIEELDKTIKNSEMWNPDINESVRDMMTPMTEDEIRKMYEFDPKIINKYRFSFREEVPEFIRKALDDEYKEQYKKKGGQTGLLLAIEKGFVDVVEYLLTKKHVSASGHGEWPLLTASVNEKNKDEIIQLLLDHGANLENAIKKSKELFKMNDEVIYLTKFLKTDESVRHHMTPKPMTEISNNVVDNILKDYTDHTMYFTNKGRFGLDKLGLSHHTGDGFMNSVRKKFGMGIYLHVDDDSDNIIRKYLHNLDIDYTPIMSTTYRIKSKDKVMRMIKKLVEEVINENLPMIMIRKFNE